MKKPICGVIAQHFWDLPPQRLPNANEDLGELLSAYQETHDIGEFVLLAERGLSLDIGFSLLSLKERRAIQLRCLIPYEEQHINWPEEVRDAYFRLLSQCDEEHMVQRPFTLLCYQNSFRYLISHCDTFLVFWNGRPGDAGDAVQFIRRKGRPLTIVNPANIRTNPPSVP